MRRIAALLFCVLWTGLFVFAAAQLPEFMVQ